MRNPEHPVQPIILNRWSSRAMSGESLSDKELMPLFEAAKWAPSSFNAQPWRFVYAKRDTPYWKALFDLLYETNQTWTAHAAALVLVVSHKVFEHNGKPSQTHSFDAGAAWMNLALEGHARELVVHAMGGFDYELARQVCKIPDTYQVEAIVAIGKKGPSDHLSPDLQAKEIPSNRKPLSELVMEGIFKE